MAANKNLDPTTCTTASEAFKYPLPQVRQFHRSLTAELDEKNARLRTLVGGSYRQLLGTAEMILQMREDIGEVEEKLGRVGKGCGRGVVGGMATGLGKLQAKSKGAEGRGGNELEWVAKMKVLNLCAVVVGRLLRKGGNMDTEASIGRGKNLVLAAKVLVLSRLLAKSLGDSASERAREETDLVEESRRKLGSLRRRLLRAIESTLEKVRRSEDREDLVQALCAYSLATSSGAKDVLRHFLHVRGEALSLSFEDEGEQKREMPGVLRALELFTKSLLDVQALVPRRLADALSQLKTKPLLKDEALRELEGLRLDVCEKWFGDEILFFTPYVRHDDLDGPQAVDTLKGWAKKASEVLLQGLAKSMQTVSEFKTVVELRTKTLEVWIKDGGKAKGFSPSVILDGLRDVVNDRMVQLLESRVAKLHLVGTEIEATLGAWQEGITDKNHTLWEEDLLNMEIFNGANYFKQGILARTYGRNDAVSRAFRGYQTWRHLVDEIITVLEQLKKQRWDDDLEDMEDDISLESRNTLLSREDPQMLQDHLDTSLEKAYADLHEKIALLLTTYKDSENIGQISTYILRILRDIRSELPKNASLQIFGLSLVPSLHERLASSVSAKSVPKFAQTFFTKKRVAGRGLWEGSPELPVQPSPSTFEFLHSLALAMANAGGDLWSPAAVNALKRHLRIELWRGWTSALKGQEEKESIKTDGTTANGVESEISDGSHENGVEVTEKSEDIMIQALFDILVLDNSLEVAITTTEDQLKALEYLVERRIDLESGTRRRLQQAAKEYWKRTSLLFGLLA